MAGRPSRSFEFGDVRSAPTGRHGGRQGLPSEAVLRCALVKQYHQLSYEELAFHLEDSTSFRALYEERQAGTLSLRRHFSTYGDYGIHGLNPIA